MSAVPFGMRSPKKLPYLIPFLILLTLAACKDNTVNVQRIEKGVEHIPGPESVTTSSHPPIQTQEPPESVNTQDSWVVPENWTKDETPRSMRLATYTIPTESGTQEVAISRFPGHVGGTLANINRWRGQMGLQPINESQLESSVRRFSISDSQADSNGYQTRIESEQGVMIAVALFDESINQTWFVRATLATLELADELEEEIVEFALSILQ